jgi:hypothetical protein
LWGCLQGSGDEIKELNKECLIIKFIPAVKSSCSNWEFLPILAPEQGCIDKGLIPTAECPCRWRTGILNDNVILTPPATYLWDIIRIMTTCNGFWYSPYAKCAM